MIDKARFERGLVKRKAVLGGKHVERSLAQADEFNRPFQELVTEVAGVLPGETGGRTRGPALYSTWR